MPKCKDLSVVGTVEREKSKPVADPRIWVSAGHPSRPGPGSPSPSVRGALTLSSRLISDMFKLDGDGPYWKSTWSKELGHGLCASLSSPDALAPILICLAFTDCFYVSCFPTNGQMTSVVTVSCTASSRYWTLQWATKCSRSALLAINTAFSSTLVGFTGLIGVNKFRFPFVYWLEAVIVCRKIVVSLPPFLSIFMSNNPQLVSYSI